jgi:RNA polymerase sigma factor (sigma-70 family)
MSADYRNLLQAGYRFALSVSHDEDQAKDLVQEAWAKLWGRYDPITKSLLFTTIRNRWVDEHRRHRLTVFDDAEPESTETSPEVAASFGELHTALGTLRPEEREALFLSAVEGYTAQEIAELSARPRGTVLSLLHRAKAKLRREFTAPRTAKEQSS